MLDRIRTEWDHAQMDAFHDGYEFKRIEFFRWFIGQLFNEEVCRARGHDWGDDEGHAGPDSGYMRHTCKRCGDSFTTTLY